MGLSFEQALIEVWRQAPRRGHQGRRTRHGALPRSPESEAPSPVGGFRVRGERGSWTGTEPSDEIALGADGTLRQESDAVP